MHIKDIGFESRFCPKQQITAKTWQIIDYYNHYRNGHLPEAGSVSNQPAYLMRAFSLLERRLQQNEAAKRGNNGPKTKSRI